MTRTTVAVAVAVVAAFVAVVAALVGCAPVDEMPASPVPTVLVEHDDGEVVTPEVASGATQREAIVAAEKAMRTFAQPDLSPADWYEAMLPLLSESAGVAYRTMDPTAIPVRRVLEGAYVLEGSTEVALIVRVPTDVGAYNVSLTRSGVDQPWLAERIRPADA
ncbi:MAG: hypothetical protein KF727_14185 [Microbacteriaceae bacterium]|nr:hypothetical protein [Microbacteriaceae bacterium]